MPEISETNLPGIGLRHEFGCGSGTRVGVISRHSGRKELIVYDRRDPDAVKGSVDLSPSEAATLGEMLGGSKVVESIDRLSQTVEGLAIDWVELPPDFPTGTIAERAPRTRTGVTVVAVVRGEQARPAPGPDEELRGGDTAVIVGTTENVTALAAALVSPGA